MRKIELKLNGKVAVIGGPGPKAQRIIDFVKSIREGEFFTGDGIAEKIKGTNKSSVEQILRKHAEEVTGHVVAVNGIVSGSGRQNVYGTKKSIAKLRDQLESE